MKIYRVMRMIPDSGRPRQISSFKAASEKRARELFAKKFIQNQKHRGYDLELITTVKEVRTVAVSGSKNRN